MIRIRFTLLMTLMAGALCLPAAAQEKKEKKVEGRPPAEKRDARPQQPAPRPATPTPTARQAQPRQPSHGGSLHYAERYSDRNAPRRVEDRGSDRRDFDRPGGAHVDIDVNTRSPITFGTTIRTIPRSAREVTVYGRPSYVYNDHYYRPIRIGTEVRYVTIRPPFGARVRYIPDDFRIEIFGGRRFYVAGDIYYEEGIYDNEPGYVVVEPPLGATLYSLPEQYTTIYIPGGHRYICIGDSYYRPIMRSGRPAYVHVSSPVRRVDQLTGIIAFRGRPETDDDIEVNVRLLDISEPGALPEVVAEQTIAQPDAVPIPFELRFDPESIDPRRIYALHAEVRYDGQVRWATRTATPVLSDGRPANVELVVEPAGP